MTQFGTNPTYIPTADAALSLGLASNRSRLNLGKTAKVEVMPASAFAWIEEANPTTAHASGHPMNLSSAAGARERGYAKWNTIHTGKVIHKASLWVVNNGNLPDNQTRTLSVSRLLRVGTTAMTWNTYDGTNAWQTAGGLGAADQAGAGSFEETEFRPTPFDDTYFLDMTSIYASWCDSTNPNNGILLSVSTTDVGVNKDLNLFTNSGSFPGYNIRLVVEYSDDQNSHGFVSDDEKLSNLYWTMQQYSWGGGNTWSSGMGANGLANAHEQGGAAIYRTRLAMFMDTIVDPGGVLISGITSFYMGPPFGEALIYLHQSTGSAKYKTAADTMKDWLINTATRDADGIIMEGNKTESELIYCALPFLAKYAQTYGDADKSIATLVIDQALRMYELLTPGTPEKIPYHMRQFGIRKGYGWGRGMGWIMAGTGKLCRYSVITGHSRFNEIVERFNRLAYALANRQRSNGMWGGIVTDSNFPDETSGTALIALGFEVGAQTGVLNPAYYNVVNRAISGLLTYSRTGAEMSSAWPSNQDGVYTYTNYQRNAFTRGAFFELTTNVQRR